jgi:hypothetical protein
VHYSGDWHLIFTVNTIFKEVPKLTVSLCEASAVATTSDKLLAPACPEQSTHRLEMCLATLPYKHSPSRIMLSNYCLPAAACISQHAARDCSTSKLSQRRVLTPSDDKHPLQQVLPAAAMCHSHTTAHCSQRLQPTAATDLLKVAQPQLLALCSQLLPQQTSTSLLPMLGFQEHTSTLLAASPAAVAVVLCSSHHPAATAFAAAAAAAAAAVQPS